MRQVFIKWITLDAQNYIPEVWYAVLAIWLGLVVFGFLSLRTQRISPSAKLIWEGAIFLLPLFGLFAYCCFCLSKVDYYFLESWLPGKPKEGRS